MHYFSCKKEKEESTSLFLKNIKKEKKENELHYHDYCKLQMNFLVTFWK